MTTNMPGALDTFVDPGPNDNMITVSHRAQHDNANDGLAAVEKIVVGPAVFNVKGYGAKGDGTTNDAAAIQAAINAGIASGGMVIFPAGTYSVAPGQLTINGPVSLVGMGSPTISADAAGTLLTVSAGGAHIQGINFATKVGVNPTSGNAIVVVPAGSTDQIILRDVNIDNTFNGISFANFNGVLCDNVAVSDLYGSYAYYMTGPSSNVAVFTRCSAFQTSPYSATCDAWVVDSNVATVKLLACGATGVNRGLVVENTVNGGTAPSIITAFDFEVDHAETDGIYIGAGQSIALFGPIVTSSGQSGSGNGNGINVAALGNTLKVIGGQILDNAQHGIAQHSGDDVVIADCLISGNGGRAVGSYNGIDITGTSNIVVKGCRIGVTGGTPNDQTYGVVFSGGSTNGIIEGNNVLDNATAGMLLVGSVAHDNLGYNPVGAVSVAVSASGTAVASQPYDRTFYVTAAAGGCTLAIEGGPSVVVPASALGTVRVPAGQTVTPTYTTAPTWVVEGD